MEMGSFVSARRVHTRHRSVPTISFTLSPVRVTAPLVVVSRDYLVSYLNIDVSKLTNWDIIETDLQ